MKRILAILCAMVCLFALAVPALAAPDTIVITAQVPADWEYANVYAWNTEEDKLSDWPGNAMTKGADGRYTVEIPSGYANIIINSSDGQSGPQTSDLSISGDANAWIVFDGTTGTVYTADPGVKELGTTTPPAAPTLPDGDKVTVYAYVPDDVSPKLWAWHREGATDTNAFQNWPGESFSKSGDWWSIQMPATCNFIIVNDGTDSKKTADTEVDAGKDLWVVVQYDWVPEVFYSEPNLKEVVKEAPSIDENPLFSRPTLGEETTTTATEGETQAEETGIPKKTQAIIVIATAVIAIVAIAFVLSIPKKLK